VWTSHRSGRQGITALSFIVADAMKTRSLNLWIAIGVVLVSTLMEMPESFASASSSYNNFSFRPVGISNGAPSKFAIVATIGTTTTMLDTSLNPSTLGLPVTFTATVLSSSRKATGKVTFKSGSAALGTASLTDGVATLTTTTLRAGTDSITAVYDGSASLSGSTSSVVNQVVNPGTSAVVLTSSLSPSTFGESVIFTATVSSSWGTPAGKVTFKNGTANLGTTTLTGGVAMFATTTLSVGTKFITAVYGGSVSNSGSTSTALTQVVSPATSAVILTSSLNPSTFGQPVTFTATVSSQSGSPPGKVTFKNGTAILGTVTLTQGVATLTTGVLALGTLTITSAYLGSTDFSPSSTTLTQTVNTVSVPSSYTLTAAALNPGSISAGNTSTSTVTVTPANGYTGSVSLSCSITSAGSPAPSCSFSTSTVTIGGANPGTSTLMISTSSSTPSGSYTISVAASDTNNLVPINGTQTLTLTIASGRAFGYMLTATTLNPGWVISGNTSTSTVTVGPANGYTGNVSLSCSVTTAGSPAPSCSFSTSTVTISGANPGTSTLVISTSSSTPGGSYTISVSASDTNNLGPINGSQTLTLTTVPIGSPIYALIPTTLNPSSVTAGNTSTSTVTVTPANGYTGSVSLSCSVAAAGSPAPSCYFSTSPVTISDANPGTSSLMISTSSSTPGGSYTISVSASDTNNLGPINGTQTLILTTAAVIQHIVIIVQENRSPDNLFQDSVLISRGADIASSGLNSLGQLVPLTPIDLGTVGSYPQNYDLGHTNGAFVSMYDGGKMDGADLINCSPTASCPPYAHPNPQFMYVIPSDVQPYFALAEQYTFGDRMFQTNQGPSFPAHQFIISGTSAPTAISQLFDAENPNNLNANVGCIAPLTTTVAMIDATGSETNVAPAYPCFEHPTLTDLLETEGVTWRYYTPFIGSIWTGPVAIQHMCQQQSINGTLTCTGPDVVNNVIIPQTQVLTDISNGALAQVSWIVPDGTSSDHALANDGSGPSWVASIVNAIGNSAYWANTAIIITWDDWGGWYDHVAPKVINDGVSWGSGYVYGFRVPLIVVSPYAKAAYISHNGHDFGSILKYVETTFNLPSLGYADVAADDLSDCFNLTQTPLTFSVIPSPLDAQHFINDKRAPTAPDDD